MVWWRCNSRGNWWTRWKSMHKLVWIRIVVNLVRVILDRLETRISGFYQKPHMSRQNSLSLQFLMSSSWIVVSAVLDPESGFFNLTWANQIAQVQMEGSSFQPIILFHHWGLNKFLTRFQSGAGSVMSQSPWNLVMLMQSPISLSFIKRWPA